MATTPDVPAVTMTVAPASERVQLGSRVDVAVVLDVPDGWHIYWENPGQSGLATDVRLTTRPGVIGPVWPAPTRFTADGLTSYGYSGRTGFVFVVFTDRPGPLVLDAAATWLLCRDICIRGEGAARAALTVAGEAPPPPVSSYRSRLPKPFTGKHTLGSTLNLRLPGPGPFDVFPSVPLEGVWAPSWHEEAGVLVLDATFNAPIPPDARLVITRGDQAFTLTLDPSEPR